MKTSNSLTRPRFHDRSGVALVIILAFVVLLTGLVVAFFSRAVLDRQISNSSASQTKVDLFTQGAVDMIVADLKQEIADGSTVSGNGVKIYMPKPGTNNLLPAFQISQGFTPAIANGVETDGLANLLKRSDHNLPFYTGPNYSNPPQPHAANLPTTKASLNGRSISLARWNKPLLMAATSTSDLTPPNSTKFIAPDWVLVERSGSNTSSSQSSVTTPDNLTWSGTNSTTVIGRYAYTIYDEGGLLDVNVAGYPSTSSSNQYAYKPALAYADVSQVLTAAGVTSPTTLVDKLVGWRNNASANASGSLASGYTFSSGSNYYNFVLSNTTGFLKASGTAPLNNNQSDKKFTSRQELIKFLMVAGSSSPSNVQTALQYLGTFSRDLSQPSFAKNSSAPKILPYNQPANKNGGNNEHGRDATVNPSFMDSSLQVSGTFTRNDGTTAQIGEPLVKKRFALSRLAWITYQGPSANRNLTSPTSGGADDDIYQLENTYGVSKDFLLLGTAANIQKYFGLTWNASNSPNGTWTYDQHNGGSGPIKTLGAIAALQNNAHDPDFFELLKASINAGSKAKTETAVNGGTLNPWDVQFQRDASYDYAILQLGANIIEQSKVDGYCVRIVFNDGSLPQKEFQGVENLPYVYRARYGVLKIRQEQPALTGEVPVANAPAGAIVSSTNTWGTSQGLLQDPGVSLVMLLPELWNPHDINNPLPNLRPTSFRLVADSTDPDNIKASGTSGYYQFAAGGQDTRAPGNPGSTRLALSVSAGGKPFSRAKLGTGSELTGSYQGYPHAMSPSNTSLTFSISGSSASTYLMFREPTLLARADLPSGSGLKIDNSGWSSSYPETQDYQALQNSSGPSWQGKGFVADVKNPLCLPTTASFPATQQYVGTPVGFFPSEWIGPRVTGMPQGTTAIYRSDLGGPSNASNFTYRLQYKDPVNSGNWITYDTKYLTVTSNWEHNILGAGASGGLMQAVAIWASYIDPRTSRFGAANPTYVGSSTVPLNAPGAAAKTTGKTGSILDYAISETAPANAKEWLDQSCTMLISNRPATDSGYFLTSGTSAAQGQAAGWYSTNTTTNMIQGLYSQNSASISDNGQKYSGTFGTNANGSSTGVNFYTDADGVVRRAMGAYGPSPGGSTTPPYVGLPMAATFDQGHTSGVVNQSQSRPWILHRPFHAVAELGYVFSGNPWKNIDFFTPESGDAALLDVFTVNDTDDPNGLVAGKVNLNTRQAPVLQAVLTGAYADEQSARGTVPPNLQPPITSPIAKTIITDPTNGLLARTTSTATSKGPLQNVSELVGKWVSQTQTSGETDGSLSYDGFSKDLSALLISAGYSANSPQTNIQRFRESVIRPLAAVGMTRVWNLMIDVIAQTGRYPTSATTLDKFNVEGEQRYWVHLAIDRYTGQVIDKQIEVVKE